MIEVNKKLLRNWFKEQEKTNPTIKADAMKAIRISTSTLHGVLYGKQVPNPQARLLWAQFTGLAEERLFPEVKEAA